MGNSTPHEKHRALRWFFIGIEAMLALTWCGLFVTLRLNHGSRTFEGMCAWSLGISLVLLLFVLPWFWATLRHVALIGWLMAAASVWVLLGCPPWR